MIGIFEKLIIETHSLCNRRCVTCLRQNDPTKSRWSQNDEPVKVQLPSETVYNILNQAKEMKLKGKVCLDWFNEPLLDPRLPNFAHYAKELGLPFVYIATNGDLLTPQLAQELDGILDMIAISLYERANLKKFRMRVGYVRSLFKKTEVLIVGKHVTTHYSPRQDLQQLIQRYAQTTCWPLCHDRMIVSYTGEMALCCEDIALNWNLGNIKDHSLEELWFSAKHQKILESLNKIGGRHTYEYCKSCPRYGTTVQLSPEVNTEEYECPVCGRRS